jgi:hypothetical protein
MRDRIKFADVYRRKGNYHLKGDLLYCRVTRCRRSSWLEQYQVPRSNCICWCPFRQCRISSSSLAHVIPLRTASVSETAATILLQGLTAHYLATDSHKIQKRKQCLFMLLLRSRPIFNLKSANYYRHSYWSNLIRIERNSFKNEPTKCFILWRLEITY